HLHLEGTVLHRGREVLDLHERQRWQPERLATYFTRAGGEAEFEPCHGRKTQQPTLDARVPLGNVRRLARLHAHVCRLVDQPVRHRHAASITSGSPRSPNVAAERLQSSAATVVAAGVEASCSSRRRRNSFRDSPSAAASASMRSTAASLSPRISTFAIVTTSTMMISRYHSWSRAPPTSAALAPLWPPG